MGSSTNEATIGNDRLAIDQGRARPQRGRGELSDALAARRDPERLLRRRVQAAYLKYFGSRFEAVDRTGRDAYSFARDRADGDELKILLDGPRKWSP